MGRLWRENGEFHLEVRGKEKSEEGKKQSRPPVTRPPDRTTPDTNMESRDPTTRTGRPHDGSCRVDGQQVGSRGDAPS